MTEEKKVNLGCGRDIMAGAINLDRVQLPGVDVVCDLGKSQLPFDDDSIDVFYAYHLLEHLPNLLDVVEELWRCAKPDGRLMVRVPHGASNDADEDPTHVRRFFEHSWGYFSQPYYWRADYNYAGDWQCERIVLLVDAEKYGNSTDVNEVIQDAMLYRNIVVEMRAELRAVKPARERRHELQIPYPIDVQLVRIEGIEPHGTEENHPQEPTPQEPINSSQPGGSEESGNDTQTSA